MKENSSRRKSSWAREDEKYKGKEIIGDIWRIKKQIPKKFQNKNFANYNNKYNPEGFNICRNYAKNLIENLKNGKGLFITGVVGTGKTHLVIAIIDYIARILKRKRIWVIYTTAVDLLTEIKYSYDRHDTEETISGYENCALLIIDDIGIEKTTDWTDELLYKIIDTRYSEMRSLIVTTNLNIKEVKNKLSERIVSRIYEMCRGVKLRGEDYRLKMMGK